MVVSEDESIPSCQFTNKTLRHLMTGIGSYFYIVWAIWLRLCLNERQDEFMLRWPSLFFSLPEVISIASSEKKMKKQKNGKVVSSSNMNGHAKEL